MFHFERGLCPRNRILLGGLGRGAKPPSECPSMALFRSIGGWLEERTGLGAALAVPMGHRVPRSTASWAYVFGSATLILFVMQIATGICLALVYVPSPDQAYESLQYLNYQAALGWYLRAMHFWGSNAMVLV